MYGLMVNKYFVKVETGMKKIDVIDGPVYGNSPDDIVGKITWYNPKNGFMKIELISDVDYKSLIRIGIKLEHIIFSNKVN